jgi:hypothetical protein
MKKYFRQTEIYTSHNATKPVELDSDMFPDFKGETEQEFFDYVSQNYNELLEDENFSEEVKDLLGELAYGEKEEYYNSCFKYYEGELQMGELDEKASKNGRFNTQYSSEE